MSLHRLLQPNSIAILGASPNSSASTSILASLRNLRFAGSVFPINPRYSEVGGYQAFPTLTDLPASPDVVAFCVANETLLEVFELLPSVNAGAAVVYGGGFAESSEAGRKLEDEIAAICRKAQIALCGPNCMGTLNPAGRSSTFIDEIEDPAGLAGNVGFISHSGSIAMSMLTDVRRFGFSHMISAGNEAVIDTADYIDFLVDDPATSVIGTFTETIRNPKKYLAALDRAADNGKPVIVLKVGKTERTHSAIASHTGGLAGSYEVFSQVVAAHRAIEVNDINEMTEMLAAFQPSRRPTGRRHVVVTASGGQAELALDVADEDRIHLPPLDSETRASVEKVVGRITGDGNPLDAWGVRGNFGNNLSSVLDRLCESPDLDNIILCRDTSERQPFVHWEHVTRTFAESARRNAKPHFLLSMRSGLVHPSNLVLFREVEVPVVTGLRQGLKAIDAVAAYWGPIPAERRPAGRDGLLIHDVSALSRPRATIHEADAKRILASYGLSVTRESTVVDLDEAVVIAQEIGYPIVLKVVNDEIPHKSDYGLVAVNIANRAELEDAWSRLSLKLAEVPNSEENSVFLVQEMVHGGVEVFAGVSRDADFGLVLVFGMGGTAIEVFKDFTLRPLPLRAGDAESMVAQTKVSSLLAGVRGAAPCDVKALVDTIYRLSDYACAEGERLAEIDLNPIKVLSEGKGCIIVDALIVPQRHEPKLAEAAVAS